MRLLRRIRQQYQKQRRTSFRGAGQRGTSENTNRLLRQYLPRKSDLSVYSQHALDLIALKLNTRPRKTLAYNTPAATLAQTVALTD